MNLKRLAVLVVAPLLVAAGGSSVPNRHPRPTAMIDEAAARTLAKQAATRAYRDLSIYRVKVELRAGAWHVDYDLEGPAMAGGGPHYVISGETGEIIESRYEQ